MTTSPFRPQSLRVSLPAPDLVHISHGEETRWGPYDSELWLDLSSVPWLIDIAEQWLAATRASDYAWVIKDLVLGNDTFKSHTGGTDYEWRLLLSNERSGRPSGRCEVALNEPGVELLLQQLGPLVDEAPGAALERRTPDGRRLADYVQPRPLPRVEDMVRIQTVRVSQTEPELVHIFLRTEGPHWPKPVDSQLWFSRDNVPWLIDLLNRWLPDMRGRKVDDVVLGDDHLTLIVSGTVWEDLFLLLNERRGRRTGSYELAINVACARDLLSQLRALVAGPPATR
jgi:hypothetical protein